MTPNDLQGSLRSQCLHVARVVLMEGGVEGKRRCTGFGPRLVEQSRLRYLKPDPTPMLNQHKTDSETTSYNPKKVSSFGRGALA